MAAPAPVKVRILRSLAENPLTAEMRSRGADAQALAQLEARLSSLGAVFSGFSIEQALRLREKAQAVGGQAVLCRPLPGGRGTPGKEAADVLVAGSVETLKLLSQSLAELAPAAAEALE